MSLKRKRRLTEEEVSKLREIMDSAEQGKKPTIRQLARFFQVNQPSIVKSLGGWDGIKRNRPDDPIKPITPQPNFRQETKPVVIEPFTTQVPKELDGKA